MTLRANGSTNTQLTAQQNKTGRSVTFELTDQTRQALEEDIQGCGRTREEFLFNGGRSDRQPATTQWWLYFCPNEITCRKSPHSRPTTAIAKRHRTNRRQVGPCSCDSMVHAAPDLAVLRQPSIGDGSRKIRPTAVQRHWPYRPPLPHRVRAAAPPTSAAVRGFSGHVADCQVVAGVGQACQRYPDIAFSSTRTDLHLVPRQSHPGATLVAQGVHRPS